MEVRDENQQLRAQVRSQRERLDDLLASVPGMVWEAWGRPDDPGQRMAFVSPYVEQMLGYPVQEWLETPRLWLSCVHPEDRAHAVREMTALYDTGGSGVVEFRGVSKGGQMLWVEVHAVTICGDAGQPVGMRGVTMDVTAHKDVEEALRYSERFARATLDALSAQIAIVDECGVIVAVNRAWLGFAEANGGSVRDIGVGSNYLTVSDRAAACGSREAAEAAQGIRAVLSGETDLYVFEYPCHSPTEPRWFSVRVTPFAGEGPARVVVAHENITARKLSEEVLRVQVEEQARTTRLLERRNQELDQFAYVTSHDLKAPLRGMANLARWIEEDLGESLTPEIESHLTLLRGRAQRMEAMIEGILQYSRVDRVSVKREAVDVGALLTEAVDLLDPPAGFTIKIAPEMPTLVTERLRLEQVFMNLISNAVKHSDRDDGCVSVGVRDLGKFYEFTVADDGPGIAPQYHEKVFVIFQTLEARDKKESTGVGLALVRKIVESYGGTIVLESEVGQGAAFRFTWPKTLAEGT